jgi:glycosyltransferase involved in cell wall biosynthesis
MLSILYISYDGMLEPLGQSQVLSYLKHLSNNSSIFLISFEKPFDLKNSSEFARIKIELLNCKIKWYPLTYHKKPSLLATGWDILRGVFYGLMIVFKNKINIIHARSYVASVIALIIKKITQTKFIFDMRGFWVDERIDGGIWREGSLMVRAGRYFEKNFLIAADSIVVLTYAAKSEIQRFGYMKNSKTPIKVIPTCADLNKFHQIKTLNEEKQFILGYIGSAGTWYLFENVVKTFLILLSLKPNAKLLIINRGQHELIRAQLSLAGLVENQFELISVHHNAVPHQVNRMTAGIFFYKPSYSRIACSPTKLAEFLGCGVPCLANDGVGDMTNIIKSNEVGVILDQFSDIKIEQALKELIVLVEKSTTPDKCIETANIYFSLDHGVSCYDSIYKEVG